MPLGQNAAEMAAAELFRARQEFTRIDTLPKSCRPQTASDGYAVQSALVDKLLRVGGAHHLGYKIGATNAAARDMLGTDEAFAGHLISTYCHVSPMTVRGSDFHVVVLEPEIAVRLGRDLPASEAPFTPETVAAAVEAVAPAIEIVSSPFPVWNEAGIGNIIGDNGANALWVHGEFSTDFGSLDLVEHPVSLSVNGKTVREGAGRNVDGGPMVVLAWLANFLASTGGALKSGDLVTTGSTTQPFVGGASQKVVADFGTLGQCHLNIE
ncbi:MAG: hypothetical protein CMM47_08455 [Rhodospirillaceae bacterium]|nr:hypothetical protein [Rhodospirillaceae bacterium]